MSRFGSLDYLRGLAALGVVFFHRGTLDSFPDPINQAIKYGEIGAYIFFVISGYVIYQSAERQFALGWKGSVAFARKRIRRIYPAFWASLIFAFGVSVFLQQKTYGFSDVVSTIVLVAGRFGLQSPQVVYWTLEFEQQFYLLMALLILPIFGRIRTSLILLSSIVGILYVVGPLSHYRVFNGILTAHWLEFDLGILVYLILQHKVSRWISVPVFMAVCLAGAAGSFRTQGASLFAVLMFLIYSFDARIVSHWTAYPFRLLGTISYSLYLVHIPTFALSDLVFRNVFAAGSWPLYVSGIAMTLIVAASVWAVFERPFLSQRAHDDSMISHRPPAKPVA